MKIISEDIFAVEEVLPLLKETGKALIVGNVKIKRHKILNYIASCQSLDCPVCEAKPLHFKRQLVQVKHAKMPPIQFYMLYLEYDKIDEHQIQLKYRRATIDHIIPISKTGHKTNRTNLQLMCNVCNQDKTNDLIVSPTMNVDTITLLMYETYIRWFIQTCYTKDDIYYWTTNSKRLFDAAKTTFQDDFDLYHFNQTYEKFVHRFRTETAGYSKKQRKLLRQQTINYWCSQFSPNDFVVFS